MHAWDVNGKGPLEFTARPSWNQHQFLYITRTITLAIVPTGYGCALSHGISRNYTPPSLPLNSTPQAGGPTAAQYAEGAVVNWVGNT